MTYAAPTITELGSVHDLTLNPGGGKVPGPGDGKSNNMKPPAPIPGGGMS